MMLFVGRLPTNVTRKELKAFIQRTLRRSGEGRFLLKSNVSNCSILRLTDRTNGTCEHYGLVEIQPAKAGMRVVECLNGKDFKGAPIEVRRYHHRSLLRERRQARNATAESDGRSKERRRRTLTIDMVDAVKDLSQKRTSQGGRANVKVDFVGA
jgi:RNA recognition motif-containing protein